MRQPGPCYFFSLQFVVTLMKLWPLEGAQEDVCSPTLRPVSHHETWHLRRICGISARPIPALNSGAAPELPHDLSNPRFSHPYSFP